MAIFNCTATSLLAQAVAAGSSHSVFVCSDGEAKATGTNTFGQLGNGTTSNTSTPISVNDLTGIVATSSRDQFTLFLLSDSTVWATGYNEYGQFGNGTNTSSSTPIQIPSLTGITKIAAGFYHSLFLKSDSTVWSCGRNFSGELGDGTQTQRLSPVQVTSLSGIIDIAAGDYHSMFLKSDSTVFSCGDNQDGCLGLGSSPLQVINPTQVNSIGSVISIAGGFRHSLFIKGDNTVWASGINNQGQLGDGTNDSKTTPVQINSLSDIVAVSAGQYHSLFLKNDGTVWSCGDNLVGQLGDGSNLSQNIPVQVSGLTDIIKISASGLSHSLFLKSDDTFWACGNNISGALGNGDFIDENIPVQVLDGCTSSVGLAKNTNDFEAFIYPNPSNGEFNIQINASLNQFDNLEIYNCVGTLIHNEKLISSNAIVDLSNNARGFYLYKITRENNIVSSGKILLVD